MIFFKKCSIISGKLLVLSLFVCILCTFRTETEEMHGNIRKFDSALCLLWPRLKLRICGDGEDEEESRVVFWELCKILKGSGLARSVDVRVVGPLGQVASRIAFHMVRISPPRRRPSPNCQVMYRGSEPSFFPSLLFFTAAEVIVAQGFGVLPQKGPPPELTLYTPAGFPEVCISGASPLFLLPSAVEGKSKLKVIRDTSFPPTVVSASTLRLDPPTFIIPVLLWREAFLPSLLRPSCSTTMQQQTCVCHKLECTQLRYDRLHFEQKRTIVHRV